MRTFLTFVLAASASAFSGTTRPHPGEFYTQKFAEWKAQHSKSYATVEEEARALSIFADNEDKIEAHNSQGGNFWLGHNEFSDLTADEFQAKYISGLKGAREHKNNAVFIKNDELTLPNSVDWVAKGAVTPVKNQGQCGSCWAFSTTVSMEGAYQIATGSLVSFSEEDLVQCDTVDQGCNGGLMDNAFKWIQGAGGIAAESAYPYTSGTGTRGSCNKAAEAQPVATLTGHKDVPAKDEDALATAVAQQPVSVAIEADKQVFQLYKGGILDSKACGTQLDHGVLVVGYGASSGQDYWKVKNSWGATWGENGYIRMAKGVNQCGISQQPSYPTGVKKAAPGPAPGPSPPPPGPTPPAPTGAHYGDPTNGCLPDEQAVQIQGIAGDFCSPQCTGIFKMSCPKDVPAGVTATPECALQTTTGGKYCALICSPTLPIVDQKAADGVCGANASCKPIQGTGICTYND